MSLFRKEHTLKNGTKATSVACMDGNDGITLGLSTEHHENEWDFILQNPEDIAFGSLKTADDAFCTKIGIDRVDWSRVTSQSLGDSPEPNEFVPQPQAEEEVQARMNVGLMKADEGTAEQLHVLAKEGELSDKTVRLHKKHLSGKHGEGNGAIDKVRAWLTDCLSTERPRRRHFFMMTIPPVARIMPLVFSTWNALKSGPDTAMKLLNQLGLVVPRVVGKSPAQAKIVGRLLLVQTTCPRHGREAAPETAKSTTDSHP